MGIGTLNAFFNKFLAHDVPDGFRAVRIAFAGNEVVELVEEILLHGNAEAVEGFHAVLRFLEM